MGNVQRFFLDAYYSCKKDGADFALSLRNKLDVFEERAIKGAAVQRKGNLIVVKANSTPNMNLWL